MCINYVCLLYGKFIANFCSRVPRVSNSCYMLEIRLGLNLISCMSCILLLLQGFAESLQQCCVKANVHWFSNPIRHFAHVTCVSKQMLVMTWIYFLANLIPIIFETSVGTEEVRSCWPLPIRSLMRVWYARLPFFTDLLFLSNKTLLWMLS